MSEDVKVSDAGPREAGASVRLVLLLAVAATGSWLMWLWHDDGTLRGSWIGVLALELAVSPETANSVLGAEDDVRDALLGDLRFGIAYGVALGALAWLAAGWFRIRLLRLHGRPAILAAVGVAMVLDAVANAALLGALDELDSPALLMVAAMCGWAKWLLLIAIGALTLGGVASGLSTPRWLRRILEEDPSRVGVLPSPDPKPLGIALSGGGVRSAAVSLGALQALEENDGTAEDEMGWERAEGVTAVSGGAYMGGAWSLARGPGGHPDAWQLGSPEEQHLLDNLGYLLATAPRGLPPDPGEKLRAQGRAVAGDVPGGKYRPSAVATLLGGLVVNQLVFIGLLVMVALPYGWLLNWLIALHTRDGAAAGDSLSDLVEQPSDVVEVAFVQPGMYLPGVLWIALGVGLYGVWMVLSKVWPPLLEKRAVAAAGRYAGPAMAVVGGSLVLLLAAVPWLVSVVSTLGRAVEVGSVLGLLGSLAGVARILRKPAAKYAPKLAGFAFLVLLVGGFAAATRWSYDRPAGWSTMRGLFAGSSGGSLGDVVTSPAGVWSLALALLVLCWAVATPEWWSLAAFYRGKLRLAYATYRDDGDGDSDAAGNSGVRAYANSDAGPGGTPEPELRTRDARLRICASSTVRSRQVRTHYNIPAVSVSFSSASVDIFVPVDSFGHAERYGCTATQMTNAFKSGWLDRRPPLTTMLAVGVSGAAVSPAMGRFRIGPTSMLLAFLNVRLGVWLPNPRYVGCYLYEGKRFPRVRLGYLLKEFLGLHDLSDAFVYVTDGGHWENTGLVELLRETNYREVVCVDADAGPADAVRSIAQAVDLARLEAGVEILIDLEALRAVDSGARAPHFAERSVAMGLLCRGDATGILWYAKPALSRDMPSKLLAHRERDPSFPRVTTVDQFFDVSTFFAYRDLGRFNATCIRRGRAELVSVLESLDTHCSWREFEARFGVDAADAAWTVRSLVDLVRREPDPLRREQIFAGVRRALLPDAGGAAQARSSGAFEPARLPARPGRARAKVAAVSKRLLFWRRPHGNGPGGEVDADVVGGAAHRSVGTPSGPQLAVPGK